MSDDRTAMNSNLTAYRMAGLIRAELESRELSQAEFCRHVGVSPKHMNQVLSGKATGRDAQLDYWAFALGMRFEVTLVSLLPEGGIGE